MLTVAELNKMIIKVQSINSPKSSTFSSLITVIFDTSISKGVFQLVIKRHLSALPLRNVSVNQSSILSIPPLSCQKTDVMSD